MKTKNLKLLAVICCLITYFQIEAQTPNCSYNVDNNLSCSIVIDIAFYQGSTCLTACGTASSGVTIGPNSTANFNCGCANPCNVIITVISAGGNAIGVSTDISDFPNSVNATGANFSCGNGGNFKLTWNPGNTVIDY